MRRWLCWILTAALLLALPMPARTESVRRLTLMVYLCGSNLESEYGSASADLQEMLDSGYDPSAVTVLVMTGGSERWRGGFDPEKLSLAELGKRGMRVLLEEDARDMGEAETLRAFLDFGVERYPAEDYALVLWDHGGGPLEGVCWDELFDMDRLSLAELTEALSRSNLPKKLSWIGFDACLMGSAEVAAAVAPYADYMIASQETEPASGWSYAFLKGVEADANGGETGRRIVDAYFESLEDSGETLTLACVDLSRVGAVQAALDAFFAPIDEGLDRDSFSRLSGLRLASTGFGKAARGVSDSGFDLVDLKDLVVRYGEDGDAGAVLSAIDAAVVYSRSNAEGAAGLSVYHPYSNKQKYLERWKASYALLNFSPGYSAYLVDFGTLLTGEELADWSELTARDEGFVEGEENLFSLQLTPEQQATFAEAQLLILAAQDLSNGVYGTQATALENSGKGQTLYSPVSVVEAHIDESGLLTASYGGRTLYAVDEDGAPIMGPIAYRLSDDGRGYTVHALYTDESGREDAARSTEVIFNGRLNEASGEVMVVSTEVYDRASETFTNRIPLDEAEFTNLNFYPELRSMPEYDRLLPGFDEWETLKRIQGDGVLLPYDWGLRFFDTQLSASQLYATFQVTDTQQSRYCSAPVPVKNPNLEDVSFSPRTWTSEDFDLSVYLARDTSPLDPGLNLVMELTNHSRWTANVYFQEFVVNDVQSVTDPSDAFTPIYFSDLPPGETRVDTLHLPSAMLTGLDAVEALRCKMNIHYANHNDAREEVLRFEVSDCDVSDIAPRRGPALAEGTSERGARWELLSLERNQQGDLTGVLRIENDTAEALEDMGYVVVNGYQLSQIGDVLYVVVSPGTVGYLPFRARDSIRLASSLTVQERFGFYWLASRALLEQYGVREITDFRVISTWGYDIVDDVTMPLRERWPFSDQEAVEPLPAKPLLEGGGVSVSAERVLLADDGVGLRLRVKNDTDEGVYLLIGEQIINGKPAADEFPDSVVVGAHATVVTCVDIEAGGVLEAGEAIESVGMTFRYGDFTTEDARVTLRLPETGERYLPWDCWDTEPARDAHPGAMTATGLHESIPQCDVRADIRLINRVDGIYDFGELEDCLEIAMKVTNLTEEVLNYDFSPYLLNGRRLTDQACLCYGLEPGETREDIRYVSAAQLAGLSELTEISATLEVSRDGSYEKVCECPVRFAVSGGSLGAFAPAAEAPLAQAEAGGARWSLLGLEEDENGALTLRLYEENHSDAAVSGHAQPLLGEMACFRAQDISLAPGQDRYVTFTTTNDLRVPRSQLEVYNYEDYEFLLDDHVLEHCGVEAVEEIRLIGDVNVYRGDVGWEAVLTPPEPIALTPQEESESMEPVSMLEGDVSAWVSAVLVGDDGAALSVELRNNTDVPLWVTPGGATLNGLEARLYEYTGSFLLPPRASTVTALCVRSLGDPAPGDALSEVGMNFSCTLGVLGMGTVFLDELVPLGVEGGVVVRPEGLTADGAVALLLLDEEPEIRGVSALSSIRLAPTLTEEQAERFKEGLAVVCTVDRQTETGPDGESVDRYCVHRVCSVELERGEDGQVAGHFSGLVLLNGQDQALLASEHPFGETDDGNQTGLEVALYLYEDPARCAADGETHLDDTDYDLKVLCIYELTQQETGVSVTNRVFLEDDLEGEFPMLDNLPASQYGLVASQQIALYPEEVGSDAYEALTMPGGRPCELRVAPIRSLPGARVVYYIVAYDDGGMEDWYEAYPRQAQ